MFDFERIFVCRGVRPEGDGFSAEGIGFSHPSSLSHLLLFGHVLGARVPRAVHVYVEIEAVAQEVGPVLQQTYRLHPGSHPDRRMFLGIVRVRGELDPRHYQAIIRVENWAEARTGFEIV